MKETWENRKVPLTDYHLVRDRVMDLLEPEHEYRTTTGQRKAWDGQPDLSKEGWEEWKPWERFEYHEERYWRRKKIA